MAKKSESTRSLTINCDLGESYGSWIMGSDADVMPLIDAANIACGYHAGDPSVMRRCVRLAKQHKVEIGAHVSYPDLMGFGRRSMNIRGDALVDMLHYQMAALDGIARTEGCKIGYVKPHGALYNDTITDLDLLDDVMRAVATWHRPVDLVVLATPKDKKIVQLGVEYGLILRFEAFADRGYTSAGHLMSRDKVGAVLNREQATKQALSIAQGTLRCSRGRKLSIRPDTLCVHGETPEALEIIRSIRSALMEHKP